MSKYSNAANHSSQKGAESAVWHSQPPPRLQLLNPTSRKKKRWRHLPSSESSLFFATPFFLSVSFQARTEMADKLTRYALASFFSQGGRLTRVAGKYCHPEPGQGMRFYSFSSLPVDRNSVTDHFCFCSSANRRYGFLIWRRIPDLTKVFGTEMPAGVQEVMSSRQDRKAMY